MAPEEWAEKERNAEKSVEEICNAGWMRLQKNTLQIEGSNFERFTVFHSGGVAILPITKNGNLILERQYRYPIDEITLEVPAGRLDLDEEPEIAARRELQEEIGFDCDILEPAGTFYPSPGYCTEKVHLFIAKKLKKSSLEGDLGEVIEQVELSPNEALAKIRSGEISDGKTVILILKLATFHA